VKYVRLTSGTIVLGICLHGRHICPMYENTFVTVVNKIAFTMAVRKYRGSITLYAQQIASFGVVCV